MIIIVIIFYRWQDHRVIGEDLVKSLVRLFEEWSRPHSSHVVVNIIDKPPSPSESILVICFIIDHHRQWTRVIIGTLGRTFSATTKIIWNLWFRSDVQYHSSVITNNKGFFLQINSSIHNCQSSIIIMIIFVIDYPQICHYDSHIADHNPHSHICPVFPFISHICDNNPHIIFLIYVIKILIFVIIILTAPLWGGYCERWLSGVLISRLNWAAAKLAAEKFERKIGGKEIWQKFQRWFCHVGR